MGVGVLKQNNVKVEIKVLNPEKVINELWNVGVDILNVQRCDIVTFVLEVRYEHYSILKEVVEDLGGKVKILGSNGFLFFLGRVKKSLSLVGGGAIFLLIIFCLSKYIWRVEINTVKNVAPHEIRQQLYAIGIRPGIKKTTIDVKDIEKKIEDCNSDVLWIRARMEGSTLRVVIEEKVNPPEIVQKRYGNLAASMDGEVTRIYTYSGKAAVSIGSMAKVGQVLIEGVEGNEEETYQVNPDGVVMANTFYEKRMKVKINGTESARTGRQDSDIYLNVFGKKIYIKKAIKGFEEYDKIEECGKIFSKVKYFERGEVEVSLEKDNAVEKSVDELEKSILKTLTREARVVDKIVSTEDDGNGSLFVNVIFVVEQNIVNNNPV